MEYVEQHDVLEELCQSRALLPIWEEIHQKWREVDINQNDEQAIFRSVPKILPDEDFCH